MTHAIPGRMNQLSILRINDTGAFLDGGSAGDILLPTKWIPKEAAPGSLLEVFVYFDNLDRLIATTLKPLAQLGDFAVLKAAAVNQVGAFLNWGLEKDLLVPYREQTVKMIEGQEYLVYIFADSATGRLAGSSKLENYLNIEKPAYQADEEVELIIWKKTDLGYKAIVNKSHEGLLYANEVFTELKRGDRIKAYVDLVREDGKIDLRLLKTGHEKIDELADHVLKTLEKHHGFMALNDHSPASEIYSRLGMSKKNFKKAIGKLYKQRLIDIETGGIRLTGSID
jgi:uncharacterized protein